MTHRYWLGLACLLGLFACTPSGVSVGIGGGSGNFGIGTTLNFPIGGTGNTGGIQVSEEQIVTYFDAGFKPQRKPAKGGYYRELLAKRSGHLYLVQDFYEDSRKKRTDPMLLSKDKLEQFHAFPTDGSHSVYYESGRLATQTQYQNGQALRSQSWADR